MTILTYKGYTGKVEVDVKANLLYGEVVDLKDVITFQGDSVPEAIKALEDSIEDCLEFCALEGLETEKPFSGKFIVRLTPEQDAIHDLEEKRFSKEQIIEKV